MDTRRANHLRSYVSFLHWLSPFCTCYVVLCTLYNDQAYQLVLVFQIWLDGVQVAPPVAAVLWQLVV
ncbi:hypothetical protein OR1_02815 [Geobacter sp. OR-1]|nr:hypothetical protein OR1_02815 [Geobacter sp. OR-1]